MSDPTIMRRLMLGSLATASLLPHSWAAAPVSRPAPIKTVALFSLPFEQLWVSRVHGALKEAQARGELDYTAYENIYPADYVDLVRQQAKAGVELIIGESHAQEKHIRKLASEFPKTAFLWSSVGPPQAPNFSVFDNYIHEPAYLAGMLAADFSKTQHVGIVAGFDMPDIRQICNAFLTGAKEVSPDLRLSAGCINSWYNPIRAQRMTNALIDQGVDVVLALTHAGVVEAAAQRKIYAINCMANQRTQYPDTVLAAVMWHIQPVVKAIVHRLQTHTYRGEDYEPYSLMSAGGASLSSLEHLETRVSPKVLARLRMREAELIKGQFSIPKDQHVSFNISNGSDALPHRSNRH